MFKYAISTKMEVLNLSLGGPNYSALLLVKGFIKKIISQQHGVYNLVELLCRDIGDIPNSEATVVLPNE
ncbi:hypothetical protein MKX03_019542, partial [Papaver bracteatum]